jgi:hypothetical protein
MHSTFDEILRLEERLLNEPPAQMQSVQNQNLQYEDCIREQLERDPKLRQQIKDYEGLAERAAEKALLLRQQRHDNIAKKVFPEAAGKVRAQALETMEELREARFQKLSNPAIWIDNETADVERVEPDIRFSFLPGMSGGGTPGTDPLPLSRAWGEYTEDTRYNEFQAVVEVSTGDHFYRCEPGLHATVRFTINFVLDPPAGDWFLVRQIWSPLFGRGMYSWDPGAHPWWSWMFMECHGLRGYGSPWSPLHLSGSFRQEGRNTTHEWHQSYPIGAPYPHPGFDPWWTLSNNIWDAGVYELPGPFSQNSTASLLIRGTGSGGGAITFTINVDLAVHALHKGESDYAAFNGDGFLMFPGLALFGERIEFEP